MGETVQTKQLIKNALIGLCQKQSFRKISVQKITHEAKINRQTFYYHFKDIYDLLEWIYKNEVIDEIDNKDDKYKQMILDFIHNNW